MPRSVRVGLASIDNLSTPEPAAPAETGARAAGGVGKGSAIRVDGGDATLQLRDLALDAPDLLVPFAAVLRLRLDRVGRTLDRLARLQRDQPARRTQRVIELV